ncbi:MAG: beta-N-acetylglucosaminidase, partial [Bacteroidales bacterium]|nr:beta-N-acetylglucosaminidase [Bacteroidales bacterium]
MKKTTITFLLTSILLFCSIAATAQNKEGGNSACNKWVNNTMSKMTLEEKIGQLIIARVPTKTATKKQKKEFRESITKYNVGGLCFFAGKSEEQLAQTKEYQQLSKTPLLICLDAEWGLGMRLTDAYSFPRQMMMGAVTNDTLIYRVAEAIAQQC